MLASLKVFADCLLSIAFIACVFIVLMITIIVVSLIIEALVKWVIRVIEKRRNKWH